MSQWLTLPHLRDSLTAALELFRAAVEWIIAGYFLPPEDIAIRSMFLRAARGRKNPPTVKVVLRDRDAAIMARYKLIFPKATFFTKGFEKFVQGLHGKNAAARPPTSRRGVSGNRRIGASAP